MDARQELLLTYSSLGDADHRAGELCPACQGGSTGEHTLSVSKEDGTIKWLCHRASCGFRGMSRSGSFNPSTIKTEAVDKRGTWGRELCRSADALPDEVRSRLGLRYCITPQHIAKFQLGWDKQTQRVVIPVVGPNQEEMGCVLRSLDPSDKPKSLTHVEQGAMSWFVHTQQTARRLTLNKTTPTHSGTIIVEDQFSAIRASDYLTSVALLGTHLNEERVEAIKSSNTSEYYLALDNDAFASTIRYCLKYRSLLTLIPVRIKKDIKDMSNEELAELMGELDGKD